MSSTIRAVQAPYGGGGGAYYRTPPPDLPSLLLKERIIYLGLPLVSADEYKRQLGVDVTKLIIAQLLFLQFDDPDKPIYFYINSTGTSWYTGDAIGQDTEAFAICDTIGYVKPPVHTICIGQAMGTAAMILSAGTKGYRASLVLGWAAARRPTSKFVRRKCWITRPPCWIFCRVIRGKPQKKSRRIPIAPSTSPRSKLKNMA